MQDLKISDSGRRSGHDHGDLPRAVAGTMRVEAVVVAGGAVRARGQMSHARVLGLLGKQRSQIDVALTDRLPTSELLENVRTDLVASPADRGPEMHAHRGRIE